MSAVARCGETKRPTHKAIHSYGSSSAFVPSSGLRTSDFEWDSRKDAANRLKHGVPFVVAQIASADRRRVIAEDTQHSGQEKRWFCFGRVAGGVLTVKFN